MLDEVYCTSPDLSYGYFIPSFSCTIRQGDKRDYPNENSIDFRECNVKIHYEKDKGIISLRTKNCICVNFSIPEFKVLICRPKVENLIASLKDIKEEYVVDIKEEYEVFDWYGLSDKEIQRAEALLKL